jgi:hypothetical protein
VSGGDDDDDDEEDKLSQLYGTELQHLLFL